MSIGISLSERASQMKFGELVGITQPAVSDLVRRNVLNSGESYAEWLTAYCGHLRSVASGRTGGDAALQCARTEQAKVTTELKRLELMEKAGELVPVAEVEPQITAMITAARTELLTLPDKLATAIKTLYDVEIDPSIIEELTHESLEHLARGLPLGGSSADVPGNDDPINPASKDNKQQTKGENDDE